MNVNDPDRQHHDIAKAENLIRETEKGFNLQAGSISDRNKWDVSGVPYFDIRKALALLLRENTTLRVKQIAQIIAPSQSPASLYKFLKDAKGKKKVGDEQFARIYSLISDIHLKVA